MNILICWDVRCVICRVVSDISKDWRAVKRRRLVARRNAFISKKDWIFFSTPVIASDLQRKFVYQM
jgi:hypothetical protein